jgi:signal transduction histidine kinase
MRTAFPATLDGNDISECGAARRYCPPKRLARCGRVKFEVADQSAGSAPERVKRGFVPFAHGRTAAPGSGLGRAIVRGSAEAHARPAGIESRAGRGATFWIGVPA